jgi:hypothetical protein
MEFPEWMAPVAFYAAVIGIGVFACHPAKKQDIIAATTAQVQVIPFNGDVIRDHNGYRIEFIRENGRRDEMKVYEECWYGGATDEVYTTYFPSIPQQQRKLFAELPEAGSSNKARKICGKAFKDLEPGAQGYISQVNFQVDDANLPIAYGYRTGRYAEIHMPKDAEFKPGIEIYGGKFRREQQMTKVN